MYFYIINVLNLTLLLLFDYEFCFLIGVVMQFGSYSP